MLQHVLTHIKNDGLSVTLEHSIGGRPKKVAKRSVDSDATCFNKKNIGTLLATQDLTPDGSSLARRPTSDGSTIPSSRVSTSPLLSSCGQTRLNTLQSQTQHESHDIISRWENLADTPSSTRRVGQDTPERNAESSKACRNCHATLNVVRLVTLLRMYCTLTYIYYSAKVHSLVKPAGHVTRPRIAIVRRLMIESRS